MNKHAKVKVELVAFSSARYSSGRPKRLVLYVASISQIFPANNLVLIFLADGNRAKR